jgi:hypothetical protein
MLITSPHVEDMSVPLHLYLRKGSDDRYFTRHLVNTRLLLDQVGSHHPAVLDAIEEMRLVEPTQASSLPPSSPDHDCHDPCLDTEPQAPDHQPPTDCGLTPPVTAGLRLLEPTQSSVLPPSSPNSDSHNSHPDIDLQQPEHSTLIEHGLTPLVTAGLRSLEPSQPSILQPSSPNHDCRDPHPDIDLQQPEHRAPADPSLPPLVAALLRLTEDPNVITRKLPKQGQANLQLTGQCQYQILWPTSMVQMVFSGYSWTKPTRRLIRCTCLLQVRILPVHDPTNAP